MGNFFFIKNPYVTKNQQKISYDVTIPLNSVLLRRNP